MITPSAQWASLSPLPGELGAVARLYYGSEGSGDYVSLATKDMVLDGERFAGLLESIPSKSNGVDLVNHIPLTDSFTLTIDNLEYQPGKRFSDLLEELGTGSDIGFENRRIDVRLYLPGITTFANCLEIQTNGIMREPTHSRSMTTFTVFDGTELFLAKISHPLTETDASDTNKGLPPASRGKEKPTVYGDHSFHLGSEVEADTTSDRSHQMVKAVKIGDYRYQVSHHAMYELSGVWAEDKNSGRPVQLPSFTIIQNTSSGAIIETGEPVDSGTDGVTIATAKTFSSATGALTNGMVGDILFISNGATFEYIPVSVIHGVNSLTLTQQPGIIGTGLTYRLLNVSRFYDYHYGNGNVGYQGTDIWSNGSRACDGDFAQRATLNTEFLTWSLVYFDAEFPAWINAEVEDADIHEVAIFGKVAMTNLSPGTSPTAKINSVSFMGDSSSVINAYGTQAATQAGISEIVDVRVADPLDEDPVLGGNLYELYKRIQYDLGSAPDEILVACKGREYGIWIEQRGTSSGWAVSHADNEDSGEMIENPAGIFESLLTDELGIDDEDYIDRESLNVLSNDLVSYLCSFVIYTSQESRDLLGMLLKDFRSFMWWNTSGQFRFKAIEDTYADSDMTLHYEDMRDLEFPRTDPTEQQTVVRLRYKEFNGAYQFTTADAEDTTQQTKYNLPSDFSTLTYDALPIPDSATALLMRNYKLAFWKQPHNLTEITMPKDYLQIDVGDILDISGMPYKVRGLDISINNTVGGQTIYKYFFVLFVDRGAEMTLTGIQLHNLS